MKSRSKNKEIALILVPSLALGAFAFYSQRTEGVGPRGLYVEKSELVPATPLDASRGNSYYLMVTLNYGGEKPKWWGKSDAYNMFYSVSPSTFGQPNRRKQHTSSRDLKFSIGDDLTIKRDGKLVVVKRSLNYSPSINAEAGRYVLKHYVSLVRVPLQAGEVTFRSVYGLRDLKPLRWKKVVRGAGEKTHLPVDHNPHATISSLKILPDRSAGTAVEVQLKHSPREDGEPGRIIWDSIEIVDSQSRVFQSGPDFNLGVRLNEPSKEDLSLSTSVMHIWLYPPLKKARPPLTLRGKISVNENWPIPFSLKLAPR